MAKAHKNLDFVLERAENGGSEGQKRTKIPILCLKGPKMWVSKAKSAQKCRFCAREEFRYGFETRADCSFKASCEKLAPFMENEVARKNMNL